MESAGFASSRSRGAGAFAWLPLATFPSREMAWKFPPTRRESRRTAARSLNCCWRGVLVLPSSANSRPGSGFSTPIWRRRKERSASSAALCVNVCRDLIGQAAIGFESRGADRKTAVPFGKPSEDCIGCGACVYVCPTGCIKMEDLPGERMIDRWMSLMPFFKCRRCGKAFGSVRQLELLKNRQPLVEILFGNVPGMPWQVAGRGVSGAEHCEARNLCWIAPLFIEEGVRGCAKAKDSFSEFSVVQSFNTESTEELSELRVESFAGAEYTRASTTPYPLLS